MISIDGRYAATSRLLSRSSRLSTNLFNVISDTSSWSRLVKRRSSLVRSRSSAKWVARCSPARSTRL